MFEEIKEKRAKRVRLGRLLTLLLLLYGLAVTVIYFFCRAPEWFAWLAPFNVPSIAFVHWFEPALLYLPLSLLALAGWMMLRLERLFGRELILGCMVVYLACNLVLTPFYLLLATGSWQPGFLGQILSLSLCGTIYPVLVLIALHIWNPRRR